MQSTLETFTQYLDLSQSQSQVLLSQPVTEFLKSVELKQQLDSLDINLLKKTSPTATAVLTKELPAFYNWLKNDLDLKRIPDSPEHTTKWVIGFLNQQESLTRLMELHSPIPRLPLEKAIPRLVALFDDVEDEQVRKEWQKAVAALCLVLLVAACEEERE
ncbi:hypothetical protein BZZ01_16100 [Nostocales cyanobacterium HT-58-2]|nr:hypothetical protein BZZ01_16100 [Nostocales cyanobacterium HT-58-2]